MVVAEVPLWVSHGNNASAAVGGATLPVAGMALPKPNDTSSLVTTHNQNANSNISQTALDRSAAKVALSLLSSTRGGSQRAPMYSTDVHPDGTRFATAAGDGTVKIWSMGCLFAGKLNLNEEGEGKKKKKKKRGATPSKFTESGNYVSSNSEDYYDTSSSSEERGGRSSSPTREQPQQPPPISQPVGVNDLSGLVRKKKGGGKAPASAAVNPFASSTDAASNHNAEGPPSPLSRLSSTTNNNLGNTGDSNQGSSLNNIIPNKSKKEHKLLSTISSHEGSVLSLRFSPSGIYLATAGDDSYVNIYVRSNSPSLAKGNLVGVGADGSGDIEDIEHWNRIAICRGHHLDVVGLAWAPDDSHLVSCSLDSVNPVIVWRLYDVLDNGAAANGTNPNASGGKGSTMGGMGGMSSVSNAASSVHIHNLHPFKILGRDVHTSTVKGVAFDPAGKYIATSGDDPAICIWRASDNWGLEARIDASNSSVFRSKKRRAKGGKYNNNPSGNGEDANQEEEEEYDDPGELASLSLFRRISFAPDGSHVCGTNATLRGKNIAAMISREGWMATGSGKNTAEADAKSSPPGAANLVGHKQPVVASRHCPVFFCVPKKSKPKKRGGSDGDSSSSSSSSSEGGSEEDDDVDYATLVALGDKRGFVTIWSTKSSRPIFKMQCSESRCTVTDISWGLVRNPKNSGDDGGRSSLVMIVSLLDGYVVALHFDIPTEVGGGQILSDQKTRRIFSGKYGIDDFMGNYGVSPGQHRPRKRIVDDAGPMLIENALQLTMEMEDKDVTDDDEESEGDDDADMKRIGVNNEESKPQDPSLDENVTVATTGNIKDKQVESTKSGKKRIRPVLMNANNNDAGGGVDVVADIPDDENADSAGKETGKKKRQKKNKDKQQPSDLLKNALDTASQAALVAEGVSAQAGNRVGGTGGSEVAGAGGRESNATLPYAQIPTESHSTMGASLGPALRIPYSTSKMFSADLTKSATTSPSTTMLSSPAMDNDNGNKVVADCTNSIGGGAPSSAGNTSSAWPCATITISCGGVRRWKDIIVNAKCTALAANDRLLVVGTADGCLYLYGTSPTLGWTSGKAFRAHPPFVLGSPVAEISMTSRPLLKQTDGRDNISSENLPSPCEMVVVTSDGNFYVYSLLPFGPKLKFKGSIVPAMQHMYLSFSSAVPSPPPNRRRQPKMARIQITESKQLMLILVSPPTKSSSSTGRLLQGFIYSRDMELWMRISDSNNFLLSDFYSSLPSGHNSGPQRKEGQGGDDGNGILAQMDRFIKSGASTMASARQMYQKVAENNHDNETSTSSSQKIVTRSHCEDRLACAIALGSASEFQTWLKYYARCLASGTGDEDALRFLVDILLGGGQSFSGNHDLALGGGGAIQSILSVLTNERCLGLEGKDVIRKAILPEMSKNRLLQRLTNEISMELECL